MCLAFSFTEYKLIGRATRASQLALGPSTLACIQKLNSLDRLHKVMIYIRIYVGFPRMNTYRLIYSLITIIVRNNHHTQGYPYELKILVFRVYK